MFLLGFKNFYNLITINFLLQVSLFQDISQTPMFFPSPKPSLYLTSIFFDSTISVPIYSRVCGEGGRTE